MPSWGIPPICGFSKKYFISVSCQPWGRRLHAFPALNLQPRSESTDESNEDGYSLSETWSEEGSIEMFLMEWGFPVFTLHSLAVDHNASKNALHSSKNGWSVFLGICGLSYIGCMLFFF